MTTNPSTTESDMVQPIQSDTIQNVEDGLKSTPEINETDVPVDRTTARVTSTAEDVKANADKDADKFRLVAVAKKRHFKEKFVYILSIWTVMVLALSLMNIHWFIPYYYAISTPILLVIRFVMYWAIPYQKEAALVLFAFANGPLTWATVMFRNSLVFHDVDRITSCYIHILPMVLSFGLRWYSDEMSLHWYTAFNTKYSEDLAYMFIWIFAVPSVCFIFHTCLYMLIVYGFCKPDEKYLNSFRYMTAKRDSWQGRVLYACGDRNAVFWRLCSL